MNESILGSPAPQNVVIDTICVKEEGCYMHDYVIDNNGDIIKRTVQRVINKGGKQ